MKQITCPHCGDTYPDFDVAHMCSRGPYAHKLKPKINERIQQLKEQARDFYLLQEDLDCSTKQLHELVDAKFAELIIRECIWALWTEECRTSDLASEEYTRGSNKIKQHFGVEE